MALNDLTGQNIQDTYQKVVQTDGTNLSDGTGSLLPISFNGNNVLISGSLIAQTYIVSESIINISSGSTAFGDSGNDTHLFSGSITSNNISIKGNAYFEGPITSSAFTTYESSSGIAFGPKAQNLAAKPYINGTYTSPHQYLTIEGRSFITMNSTDHIIADTPGFFASGYIKATNYISASEFRTTGHITASGAISSSGMITAGLGGFNQDGFNIGNYNLDFNQVILGDEHRPTKFISNISTIFNAPITASGNISASGHLEIGSILFTNNQRSLYNTSGQLFVGDGVGAVIVPQLKVNSHITASGNISASSFITDGNITGSNISASGIIISSRIFGQPEGGSNNISMGSDNRIDLSPSNTVVIRLSDSLVTLNKDTKITGNVTASGNIRAVGYISASEFRTSGHITASGDISSSGKINANQYIVEGKSAIDYNTANTRITYGQANQNFRIRGTTMLLGENAEQHVTASGNISSSGTLYGNEAYIIGHITASGNISASGKLYGTNIYAKSAYRLEDNGGTTRHIITENNNTLAIGNNNFVNGIQLTGSLDATSHITASGNISSSGALYGNQTIIAGHITASGNISSSGNVFGRQFEQIETNLTSNIGSLDGDFIYLPWTDTDTENASSTGKFVNRAVVVPGRPVKTIIRSTANNLGTSPFTMSLWENKTDAGNNNLTSITQVYGNSTGTNREAITFDWRNPDSGSSVDVAVGSKIWMGIKTTNGTCAYVITHLWEWDYGVI